MRDERAGRVWVGRVCSYYDLHDVANVHIYKVAARMLYNYMGRQLALAACCSAPAQTTDADETGDRPRQVIKN